MGDSRTPLHCRPTTASAAAEGVVQMECVAVECRRCKVPLQNMLLWNTKLLLLNAAIAKCRCRVPMQSAVLAKSANLSSSIKAMQNAVRMPMQNADEGAAKNVAEN